MDESIRSIPNLHHCQPEQTWNLRSVNLCVSTVSRGAHSGGCDTMQARHLELSAQQSHDGRLSLILSPRTWRVNFTVQPFYLQTLVLHPQPEC